MCSLSKIIILCVLYFFATLGFVYAAPPANGSAAPQAGKPPRVVITSPVNGTIVEDSKLSLQGTIDDLPFSETRILTAGRNILTKTCADSAGTSGSATVTVYLYVGRLIGPAGGEVESYDGKAKVIIPQGALNEPAQIKVLGVNQESLQSAAPQHAELLSIVECKPYGLVFNKAVSIVYTLPQPQTPGTPVELGLYDAVQDKIISTGQSSVVSADGHTLDFSIMHFSTYAALKNLVPRNMPIAAGVKISLPDLVPGNVSHIIPIAVSPGRKGMQPAIGLVYHSSNANSWVGSGFSLNPGYIIRARCLGPSTNADTRDTFYFVTDGGTSELEHLNDNLYELKIGSGPVKFYKEADDSWRAVGTDGGVLRFGQSSAAKESAPTGTFSWYLTRAANNSGNFIQYTYIKDHGKCYLSRIDYSANDTGAVSTNSVEFVLEPRDDVLSSSVSAAKIATAKRLKEIHVNANSDMVWRYVLEYSYSLDTNRSLLTSITQYASDNKNLPVQRFTHQMAK